ncbi:MAG: YigZ family protein [Bacteroidetes bacterium]|nr:YigZ family protein [Bacteroidota bacterium]MBS1935986.1 YigZ family protein [Bacteroidota bacterium]
MEEKDFYFTIERTGSAEFKDRGSKFIAFAFPVKTVDECKEKLNEIKKEHPKATHHCFAYRIGFDGNTFRVSDDGEPSGTAGKPILGQIDSKELINILIIIVRYFGGTLLGVPGLINAYKSAAALVLQTTPIIQKSIEKEFDVQFDYTQINDIMIVVKQFNCRVIEQEMQLFCKLKIAVPINRIEEVKFKLGELRNVEVSKVV